jgi:hypothetical protein
MKKRLVKKGMAVTRVWKIEAEGMECDWRREYDGKMESYMKRCGSALHLVHSRDIKMVLKRGI